MFRAIIGQLSILLSTQNRVALALFILARKLSKNCRLLQRNCPHHNSGCIAFAMNRCSNYHHTGNSTASSSDHAAALNRHHRSLNGSFSTSSLQYAPIRPSIRAGICHVMPSPLTAATTMSIIGAMSSQRHSPPRCSGAMHASASASAAWSEEGSPRSADPASTSTSSSIRNAQQAVTPGDGASQPTPNDNGASESNPIVGWDSAQLALGGDLQTLIQVV